MTAVILAGVLMAFISDILFAIETLLCRLLDILYMTFEVFSGIKTVMYNGNESYLINVFFGNDVINAVYWGMACIGFALTFAFAIISVVKKLFDSTGEKVKATYTQILTNVFKAILLILLMTALVSAVINATGVLMQQVNYLFDNAVEMTDPSSITFDDTDYATMFRIMNTIGNYSLNPAYNSRYNINAMFNAIRPDMMLLAQQNVFHFTYEGAEGSWQHSLLQIYNAQDISCDVEIDVYNETLQNAMLDCISQIKNNKNFKPLSSYTRSYSSNDVVSQLGRIVMLCGSFEAAKNDTYNKNPGLTDNLRKPYYQGSKDVYDKGQVEKDFDIGLFDWNHVVTLVAAYFLIKEFAIILFNCVARIFNIILLYIAAPGFIAVIPLDDGGKMKQWTTAFVIQSLSIFGSVMAVRLLIIFIPIIMSPQLVLFESGVGNFIAKLILVLGVCVTAEKANGLISGILADNAGYQSIMAGDVGGGMVSKGTAIAGKVAGGVAKAGFKAGTSVLSGIGTATGLTTKANAIGDKVKGGIQSMKDMGGLRGAIKSGWQTKEGKAKQEKEDKEEAKDRDTADFRKQMLGFMGNMSEKMGGANQSGARGGEQGGAQGGEQGGNQGGEQGGNFGGNFGGMFGGNQGGNFGGEQGGNFGGNQGGNQGGNFGGNQGGNFGGNFGGNQGGAFGRTAKSIPRMGGFQQSSGQKNPTNHNNK